MKQTLIEDLLPAQRELPMPLGRFIQEMDVTRKTAWTWRKSGALKTVNLYGRIYVPAQEVAAFNRRLEAGEFRKDIKPPQAAGPKPRRSSRSSRQ